MRLPATAGQYLPAAAAKCAHTQCTAAAGEHTASAFASNAHDHTEDTRSPPVTFRHPPKATGDPARVFALLF